jgi:hypothetical protein
LPSPLVSAGWCATTLTSFLTSSSAIILSPNF